MFNSTVKQAENTSMFWTWIRKLSECLFDLKLFCLLGIRKLSTYLYMMIKRHLNGMNRYSYNRVHNSTFD